MIELQYMYHVESMDILGGVIPPTSQVRIRQVAMIEPVTYLDWCRIAVHHIVSETTTARHGDIWKASASALNP